MSKLRPVCLNDRDLDRLLLLDLMYANGLERWVGYEQSLNDLAAYKEDLENATVDVEE